MDFVANLKKRCLLVAVRTLLGRFFKGIDPSQMDEPTLHARSIGMSFRLTNLQLNEDLFNGEVLHETPFRLVCGSINEVKGTLTLGAVEGRSLSFDGIDLTFALVQPVRNKTTRGGDHPSQQTHGDNALYSSLLGSMSRQQIAEEILLEPSVQGSQANLQIDDGVDAMATTIKSLIHSLRGKLSHITIRLRVPNACAAAANENAAVDDGGYTELLFHVKGDIEMMDETKIDSFGNSFRKRILFGGLRMAVYDGRDVSWLGNGDSAAASSSSDDEVQRVYLEDIFLSGDVDAMENELAIEYIDVDRSLQGKLHGRDQHQPSVRVHLSVKQVHAMATPQQVARLSHILAALSAAVPNDETSVDGADAPRDEQQSRFTVRLGDASVCLLTSERPDAMRAAWSAFPQTPLHVSLPVGHYALRTGGAVLQLRSGFAATAPADDKLFTLFQRHGGRFVSLRADFLELTERRPDVEPMTLLLIRNPLADGEHTADNTTPAIRLLMRTTNAVPLSVVDTLGRPGLVRAMRDKKVIPTVESMQQLYVLQDTVAYLAVVDVSADVETLGRILEFYSIVDAQLYRVTHSQAMRVPYEEECDEGAGRSSSQSVDGEEMPDLGAMSPLEPHELLDDPHEIAQYPRPPKPRAATVAAPVPLVFLSSGSFELDALGATMAFPVDRRPNIDVYGPLTQRLFAELVKQMSTSPVAAANQPCSTDTRSPAHHDTVYAFPSTGHLLSLDALYLSKKLRLDIKDVRVDAPFGGTELLVGNVGTVICSLKDTFEGTLAELFRAEFHTVDDTRLHNITSVLRGPVVSLQSDSPCAPSFIVRLESSTSCLPTQPPREASAVRESWRCLRDCAPNVSRERLLGIENDLLGDAPTAISLNVKTIAAQFHQDELLLLLFLVDQMVECVSMSLVAHSLLMEHVKVESTSTTRVRPSSRTSAARRAVAVELEDHSPSANGQPSVMDSALFMTPRSRLGMSSFVHGDAAAVSRQQSAMFADPPVSAIRDHILQSTKLMTSVIQPSSAARRGTTIATGPVPAQTESLLHSVGSSAISSLWGSRIKQRGLAEAADTLIAAHIAIAHGHLTLYAPRLAPNGAVVGEALYMLLPLSERFEDGDLERPKWLYHTYEVDLKRAGLIVTTNTLESTTTMHMNLRLEGIEASELLCPLPPSFVSPATFGYHPPWGTQVPLLQGYGDAYNLSHRIARPLRRQALAVYMQKTRDTTAMTQETNLSVLIDRCCLHHQAAHEGDHWLFVLSQFVSDNPTAPSKASQGNTARAATETPEDAALTSPGVAPLNSVDEAVPCPLSFVTTVALRSFDFLIQYQPLGKQCRALVLVPTMKVDVGPLTSVAPSFCVRLSVDRMSLFVHNLFDHDVFAAASSGAGSLDAGHCFGRTKKGIAADLEALGFVQVLCCGSIAPQGVHNVTVRVQEIPEKPLFVDVSRLKLELSCAYDSFYFFRLIQAHFAAGADLSLIPAPFLYASAFSQRFDIMSAVDDASGGCGATSSTRQSSQRPNSQEPLVSILVENFSSRVDELIRTKLAPPTEAALPREAIASSDDQPEMFASVHNGPSSRHMWHESSQAVHIKDIDLDDFVDVAEEMILVRQEEVLAQRVPQWEASDYHATLAAASTSGGIQSQRVQRYFSISQRLENGNPVLRNDPLAAPRKLRHSPPIAIEVVVNNCHADVALYGGTDFSLGGYCSVNDDGFSETAAFFEDANAEEGHRTAAHVDPNAATADVPTVAGNMLFAAHPPGRKVHEYIALHLRQIFVQVDMFDAGKDQSMQLLTLVKEVEVRDRIDGSPVETICMCSVPRELRDDDGWMFEMKWITRTPLTSAGTPSRPEEDLAFRLQPIILTLHRRVVDLLIPFVETPNIEAGESLMYIRKCVIHPVRLRLNVLFEVQSYHALLQGQAVEMINLLPSVEDSRVRLPLLLLESFPVADFGVRLVDALQAQMNFDSILMLLCGVQPIRTVAEATSAAAGLVLMPLEHYKKSKGLYRGILRGLSNFTNRMGAETARVASGATRAAHEVLHEATASVRQQEVLSRGSQPSTFSEGLERGAQELVDGFRGVRDIVSYCVSEDGSLAQIPLAALAPVNGVMRALTQVFVGARNSIRPEAQTLERKIYKH